MTPRTPLLVLLVCLLATLFQMQLSAAPTSAACLLQDDDEESDVEDEREDIAERLEYFDALIKNLHKAREPNPKPAIELLDGFLSDFGDLGPKDRLSMVESLAGALKIKRIRNNEEGEPQVQLYYVTVVALGEMGPEGVKPLIDALAKKPFQKNAGMLVAMAESLGQLGHKSALKALTKLMDHEQLEVLAAGAKALGNLRGLEDKVRKKLFKHMLKQLGDFRAEVDADPDDVDAYQNWGIVSGSLMNAMEELSGHEEKRVKAWETWWKANRKKTWK